jgi:hypothetical protein
VAQPLLRQQAARPAAGQAKQQERALRRAAPAFAGGGFVDRVSEKADQACRPVDGEEGGKNQK